MYSQSLYLAAESAARTAVCVSVLLFWVMLLPGIWRAEGENAHAPPHNERERGWNRGGLVYKNAFGYCPEPFFRLNKFMQYFFTDNELVFPSN